MWGQGPRPREDGRGGGFANRDVKPAQADLGSLLSDNVPGSGAFGEAEGGLPPSGLRDAAAGKATRLAVFVATRPLPERSRNQEQEAGRSTRAAFGGVTVPHP